MCSPEDIVFKGDVSPAVKTVLAEFFSPAHVQCIFAPFLDPVNNASEWFSRLNYVLTSAVSLAVAFNIPGQDVLDGPVLYV